MNDVEKAGTQLSADASILWGNEMDAYENRIPIHYIKGHTFLGRAGGMRLRPNHSRHEEMKGRMVSPLWYRIPLGIISSNVAFGEGGSSCYRLTDKGPLPPVFVEVNRGVEGVFKECNFG